MGITSYIDRVRQKPDHIKQKTAFWWAFGITAIIFVFWLAAFDWKGAREVDVEQNLAGVVSSPGTSLIAGVGALAEDIWLLVTGPKKVEYSEIEVSPGAN